MSIRFLFLVAWLILFRFRMTISSVQRFCLSWLISTGVLVFVIKYKPALGIWRESLSTTRLRPTLTCDKKRSFTSCEISDILLNIKNNDENRYATEKGFILPSSLEERKEIYKRFYKKMSPNVPVNCQEIVDGDRDAIRITSERFKWYRRTEERKHIYENISNCAEFKNEFGYIEHPLTKEELDFPIAFGILVYKDIEQIERLLRAVYRPQHFYCFHVDLAGDKDVNKTYNALRNIAECFDNVFVPSTRVDVVWGEFSILEAELICMEQLWKVTGWKYYINLVGQEFPLKTNLEVVKILKAMDGANVIYGSKTR